MSLVSKIGFPIALFGFVLAALGHKEIGIHIFIFGFYLIVFGVFLRAFLKNGSGTPISLWQKLTVIGFIIASLSFLLSYYFHLKGPAEVVFFIGFLMIFFGIIKHISGLRK